MANNFIAPSQLFLPKNNKKTPAFFYQNKQISFADFHANVTDLASKLASSPHKEWAIYLEDSFLFAIGFFSLLLAKKTIILPHNIQPKTLEILSGAQILSEISYNKNALSNENFATEISPNCELIFFTSGSTDTPKKIHKKFLHLEEEIYELAKLWPNHANLLAASVTHQHIYGLLFRLLLPLSQGILINSVITFTPEELENLSKNFQKITFISSPAFLKRLTSETFSGEFENIFSSGGLLAKDDSNKAAKIFKKSPLEILGSTETGGVAWRDQKNGEVWEKFSKIEIRLDTPNLLMVKSPYIGKEDFLAMGDTAELIDENHFLLKERSDRIIKIEEKRISLNEIENKLLKSDLIKSCHAIILDGKRQVIGVAIELNSAGKNFLETHDKSALNLFLRKTLLQYFEPITIPRKWRYVDHLPFNSQGKLPLSEIQKIFNDSDSNY